jgi:hypothetical protein
MAAERDCGFGGPCSFGSGGDRDAEPDGRSVATAVPGPDLASLRFIFVLPRESATE